MDEVISTDAVCRELGLNSAASTQLQSGIKKYIEQWNRLAPPGETFDKLGDSDSEEYCSRYLDKGWDRNESVGKGAGKGKGKGKGLSRGTIVSPGRLFWQSPTGHKRTRYEYPRDLDMYVSSNQNS